MKHIFETASDLHIRSSLIYASDGAAYVDADCTVEATAEEVKNAFNMGVAVVVDNGVFYKAVSLTISDGSATLAYIKPNSATATSADIATVTAN